jgi:hypothetical protein
VLCACGKAPDPGPQALLCGVTEGTRHATARVRAESCSAVLTVLDSAHFRTLGGDDQVDRASQKLTASPRDSHQPHRRRVSLLFRPMLASQGMQR